MLNTKKLILLMALSSLIINSGCGQSKRKKNEAAPPQNPVTNGEDRPQVNRGEQFLKDIAGIWREECEVFDDSETSLSRAGVVEHVFSNDGKYRERIHLFGNRECDQHLGYVDVSATYRYLENPEVKAPAASDVSHTLAIDAKKGEATLTHIVGVISANQDKKCGKSDWKLNAPVDIGTNFKDCEAYKEIVENIENGELDISFRFLDSNKNELKIFYANNESSTAKKQNEELPIKITDSLEFKNSPKTDNQTGGSTNSNPGTAPKSEADEQKLVSANLKGRWQTSCTTKNESSSSQYEQEFVTEYQIAYKLLSFGDSSCSVPNHSIILLGSSTILGKSTVSGLESAWKIKLDFSSVQLAIHKQSTIDGFNRLQICGKQNWQVNEPVTITSDMPNCDIGQSALSLLEKDNYGGAYELSKNSNDLLFVYDGEDLNNKYTYTRIK